jgi:hypothetical protein
MIIIIIYINYHRGSIMHQSSHNIAMTNFQTCTASEAAHLDVIGVDTLCPIHNVTAFIPPSVITTPQVSTESIRLAAYCASIEGQDNIEIGMLKARIAGLEKENHKHAEQIAQLSQQLLAISPPSNRQRMPEHTLRLLSLLPVGKMISPAHVTDFIYEAGVLHPFMEIAHTASVLTLFSVQFLHSVTKLRQAELPARETLFHLKMATISTCIVLGKLVELCQLYAFSPFWVGIMQGLLIPLAAYYADVPFEAYLTKYMYIPSHPCSHAKAE